MKSIARELLAGNATARRLLGGRPDKDELLLRSEMLAAMPVGTEVLDALRHGDAALPSDEARAASIAKLEKGAVVVCAGQQPGLFGGPLMSLVKAATALRMAHALEDAGQPAVPLFWLASEDHDFDEANRFFLRPDDGREDGELLQLPPRERDDSLHTVEMLDSDVEKLRAFAKAGRLPETLLPEVGQSFGLWCAGLVATMTAGSGLLICEPAWFATALRALRRRVLAEGAALVELVQLASAELRDVGYATPVELPNTATTLLFLETEKGRRRLDREGDDFRAGDEILSAKALEQIIEEQPERLTSAALTRPLAQQSLFPVVAQVSGATETAYMAQAMPLFQHLGLPRPLVRPRPDLLLIDAKMLELAGAAGFSEDPEAWSFTAALDDDGIEAEFENWASGLGALFEGVENHEDAFLRREVLSYRREVTQRLRRLRKDWRKDLKRRHRAISSARHRLESEVMPRGLPQDRLISAAAFGLADDGSFFRRLCAATGFDVQGRIVMRIEEEEDGS